MALYIKRQPIFGGEEVKPFENELNGSVEFESLPNIITVVNPIPYFCGNIDDADISYISIHDQPVARIFNTLPFHSSIYIPDKMIL